MNLNLKEYFKGKKINLITSIKGKLVVSSILMLVITSAIIGGLAIRSTNESVRDSVDKTLTVAAKSTAERVDNRLMVYRALATEFASNAILLSDVNSEDEERNEQARQAIIRTIDKMKKTHNIMNISIVDENGIDKITGANISSTVIYQNTKSSDKAITNDIIIDPQGAIHLISSAPILNNGKFEGAVFVEIDGDILSEVAGNVEAGKGGRARITDAEGITIGFADRDKVVNKLNLFTEIKDDHSSKSLSVALENMLNGGSGFANYTYENQNRMMAYSPIPNTNGWSIDVSVDEYEFTAASRTYTLIIMVVVALCIAIGFIVMLKIAQYIVDPINICVERMKLLANGDLKSPLPQINTNDETMVLANATGDLIENISGIIEDVDSVLGSISHGDLTVKPQADYMGEFESIKDSMNMIISSLNNTISQIVMSSEQVAVGANQVSIGAQTLAQGSTEQSGNIEELSLTVSEISSKINENSKNAIAANDIVKEAGEKIQDSNSQMNHMMDAMKDITQKSSEISKIIKTIDDIAFQTNILALNAAVEAARAGSAGKGFAVVAEEVRNLAAKSAQAANNTTALIEETVQSVSRGSKIASETSSSLEEVVEKAGYATGMVKKIASDLLEQAAAITQINQAIEQVSTVVQTNSATSEESAAASEELTAQSQVMNELVSEFKLDENTTNNYNEISFEKYNI